MKNAYTENSIWRNRDTFLKGHDAIVDFLTKKWAKENGYRLRKELFAFQDNKVGDFACLKIRPRLAGLQLGYENSSRAMDVSFLGDSGQTV